MTIDTRDTLGAEFLARITAGTTHEIRNVLAIIKESAGLIEDIIQIEETSAPGRDRIEKCVDRIRAQVDRGSDRISYLNRIAHSLDRGPAAVDLNQEVEQAAALNQRAAKAKGHRVRALPGHGEIPVTVNPLHLQMAVAAVVELCLDRMADPGVVTVRAVRNRKRPGIEFATEPAAAPVPLDNAAACEHVAGLLGDISAIMEAGDGGFRIMFPETG